MGIFTVKEIGIFYKEEPYLIELAKEIEKYLTKKNVLVYKNGDFDKLEQRENLVILSLGGDGTFLGASRIAMRLGASVLGINLGNLGFLTDVEGMDVFIAIEKLLKGEFTIEERFALESQINGEEELDFCAVNDFVVLKNIEDKILQIDIAVNGVKAGKFRLDGFVVSTATGSTAYALSLGGPIIIPQAEVYELSFIAPHKLSARPLILGTDDILEIEIVSDGRFQFLRDGLKVMELKKYDRLEFKRFSSNLKIVHIKGKNFFEILNKKFGWGS